MTPETKLNAALSLATRLETELSGSENQVQMLTEFIVNLHNLVYGKDAPQELNLQELTTKIASLKQAKDEAKKMPQEPVGEDLPEPA